MARVTVLLTLRQSISGLVLWGALIVVSPLRGLAQTCPGDCNEDAEVSIDELIKGVDIVLRSADVPTCPAIDSNNDLEVRIDELLAAVSAALNGCRTGTPTPTATSTPVSVPMPSVTATSTRGTGNLPPMALDDAVATLIGQSVSIVVLANDTDPDSDPLSVATFVQPAHGTVSFSNDVADYRPNSGFSGTDSFMYMISDGRGGTASGAVTVAVHSTPPDPATVAPPPANGVATTVADATSFLYTGADAVQFGVAPGTIERTRAAVVRGTVKNRDGTPLAGARISVLDHPEFGFTASRDDGVFDLAVNGGGTLTIDYEKTGFCPVQRTISTPWQDYVTAPDVVMIAMDPVVTSVALGASAPMQVAQGSMQSDTDGARTATLLFPPGTSASLVMPDGSREAVGSLSVRATEFTVGASGPQAMPAMLPPNSGYTYCVELSADEATAAGARSVQFDQPVFFYLENFIGFPVGTAVPVGFYDRQIAAWVASQNGRVIKILGITAGVADVDTDGDNVSDTGEGITDEERHNLATLYAANQTLWRVPVTHFTPWDTNWPFSLPDDASTPADNGAGGHTDYDPLEDSCLVPASSVIECENQVLGEALPVVGTPYTLNYRSDRVPGREKALNLTLSGPTLPASVQSIRLHLAVAGQTLNQTFPAAPNQHTRLVWNGLDAYGRPSQGAQLAVGSIDYIYPAVYKGAAAFLAAFAQFGAEALSGDRVNNLITLSTPLSVPLSEGYSDARAIGLGGWTLSVHHFYDSIARVLAIGDGRRRRVDAVSRIVNTVVPNPTGTSTLLDGLAVGADGSLYYSREDGSVITVRRRLPDGTETVVAGGGSASAPDFGDGSPAIQAKLLAARTLVIGPDQSLYIAEGGGIRRVGLDGIIRRVAGRGLIAAATSGPDGGLATETDLNLPLTTQSFTIAPDGSIYMMNRVGLNQFDRFQLRRIGPDGIVTTVVGKTGLCNFGDLTCISGGPVVALAPDGTLYFADNNDTINRVKTDGTVERFAGTGNFGFDGDGGPATAASITGVNGIVFGPDGSVLFADSANNRIRRVAPDGIITTITGSGAASENPPVDPTGDGGPALAARFGNVRSLVRAPDGTLYASTSDSRFRPRIRNLGFPLPGLSETTVFIASDDGAQLYFFDRTGRHLRTLDALTGATLFEFAYDADGRLTQVIEKTGGTDNVTNIQHDASGNPTAIVGPFGQVTTLVVDANGFLARVSNPANEQTQLASTTDGLLLSQTDPRNKTSRYTYDSAGRLIHDADPLNGSETIAHVTGTDVVTVTRSTALDRTTTYTAETLTGNVQRRTIMPPDGTQNQSTENIDAGTTHETSSDGTASDTALGPDPRFGMETRLVTNFTVSFPSALQFVTATTRAAVLTNVADPLSLKSLTQTTTVGGRTFSETYTVATRTSVTMSPTGRTQTSTIDALGRLMQNQLAGLNAVNLAYDDRGRLANVSSGIGAETRASTFAYNAEGFLETLTDPIGRVTRLEHDAAGRVTRKTLPDGRAVLFGFDAAGNPTSLTPPGRPPHTFSYSDRNELTANTPPGVPGTGPTTFAYDADRALTTVTRPDGQTITIGYDTAGRRASRTVTAGAITKGVDTFSYDAAGRLANILAASGVSLDYAYDGSLPIGATWSGPVNGSVTRTYDPSLRLATQSVNGRDTIDFRYDDDNLLTGAGDLTLVRDPQHGLPTSATLGAITARVNYNGFGEVTNYTADASGPPLYSYDLSRDALGRITENVETVSGVTTTVDYAYDMAGRLTTLVKNGVTVESYSFDSNSNRTHATVNGVTVDATYDAQDRVTQYGDTDFTYTAAGELLSKTNGSQTTTYAYDAIGNLLGVTLPDATAITYVVDGRGRRVGKRVNGTLVQGFLYEDALRPAAELDGTGAVVSRFVYAGRSLPAIMIKGGVSFRLIADPVGSVRLVVNSVTGAIAQRMDYDSFGNVLLDTNPGFQPFGFGGGLYDRDTTLVRFGARDYDAETGRWAATDPIGFGGADANLYAFVRNDPVNLIDPIGLASSGPPPLVDIDKAISEVLELLEGFGGPEGPVKPPMVGGNTLNPEEQEMFLIEWRTRRNMAEILRERLAQLRAERSRLLRRLKCLEGANPAKALKGGLKAFGEILNVFDLIKLAAESAQTGREPTLADVASTYLGFPVTIETSSTPPII